MFSDGDLDDAVTANVISRDTATALREYVAAARVVSVVDEEQFRLLSGFNDIFVSIAVVLVLAALAWIGRSLADWVGAILVAAASWTLAEYFTRTRRLALPSILLLAAFVGGVAAAVLALLAASGSASSPRAAGLVAAAAALAAAGAAWLHWRRFMVPITVAAGAAALAGVAVGLALAAAPGARWLLEAVPLICGIAIFVLAMRWDMSDRERRTRRADVAFWLHLAAAPMIAHPVFQLLGIFDSGTTALTAVVVLLLYAMFGIVALAVDRRALLVSSLAYVLYALTSLFRNAGAIDLAWAFTALAIGSGLLTLSAFWHPLRAAVVGLLGSFGRRLPPAGGRITA